MARFEVILNSDVFNPKEFDVKEEAMSCVASAKEIPHMMNIEVFDHEADFGEEDSYLHFSRKDGKWELL